jgi:cellulose synthase/poly-beta-1,6-N-acetylglucosamine synthase-like glycosyltransferase
MLELLLIGATTAIFALVLAYQLRLRGSASPEPVASAPSAWPRIDVVVPVHNEAELLAAKLDNLAALAYPPDLLHIHVVDGASTDGSADLAAAWVRGRERSDLIKLGIARKVEQINAGLARSRGPWVLISDADTRLEPDALLSLVAAALSAPDVGAVGPLIEPLGAHPLERQHWRSLNRLRRLESARGSAATVHGECYLFRRDLLDALPSDVVSDGEFVALAAAARGFRTLCVPTTVQQVRAPGTLLSLARGKLRKGRAYLVELFRSLPRAGSMPPTARSALLWRLALLLAAPALAGLVLFGLVGGLLSGTLTWDSTLSIAALLSLAALLLIGWLTGADDQPGAAWRELPARLALIGLLGLVLIGVLLTWPVPAGRWQPLGGTPGRQRALKGEL